MENEKIIKIKNIRHSGSLFHYAHFICDCLYVEIINDVYNYKEVIREKNIDQTIGNFHKIYTDVMMTKNTELYKKDFDEINTETVIFDKKEKYTDRIYIDKFRNFIFKRYDIKNLEFDKNYPEILLIKRVLDVSSQISVLSAFLFSSHQEK